MVDGGDGTFIQAISRVHFLRGYGTLIISRVVFLLSIWICGCDVSSKYE